MCAHVLAVVVNENIVEEFVRHLEKEKASSLNFIASANINTSQVGEEKASSVKIEITELPCIIVQVHQQ